MKSDSHLPIKQVNKKLRNLFRFVFDTMSKKSSSSSGMEFLSVHNSEKSLASQSTLHVIDNSFDSMFSGKNEKSEKDEKVDNLVKSFVKPSKLKKSPSTESGKSDDTKSSLLMNKILEICSIKEDNLEEKVMEIYSEAIKEYSVIEKTVEIHNLQVKSSKPQINEDLNKSKTSIKVTETGDNKSSTGDALEESKVANNLLGKLLESPDKDDPNEIKIAKETLRLIKSELNIKPNFNIVTTKSTFDLFDCKAGGVDLGMYDEIYKKLAKTQNSLHYANMYIDSLRALNDSDRLSYEGKIKRLQGAHEDVLKQLIIQFLDFLYRVKFHYDNKTRTMRERLTIVEEEIKLIPELKIEVENANHEKDLIVKKMEDKDSTIKEIKEKYLRVLESNSGLKVEMETARNRFGLFVKTHQLELENYNEKVLEMFLEFILKICNVQNQLISDQDEINQLKTVEGFIAASKILPHNLSKRTSYNLQQNIKNAINKQSNKKSINTTNSRIITISNRPNSGNNRLPSCLKTNGTRSNSLKPMIRFDTTKSTIKANINKTISRTNTNKPLPKSNLVAPKNKTACKIFHIVNTTQGKTFVQLNGNFRNKNVGNSVVHIAYVRQTSQKNFSSNRPPTPVTPNKNKNAGRSTNFVNKNKNLVSGKNTTRPPTKSILKRT